jgi:hypothetical protein
MRADDVVNTKDEVLYDRLGKSYQLRIIEYTDGLFQAWLRDEKAIVGDFKCTRESDDELELCEITISENALDHEPFVKSLVRGIFRRPRPHLNYRRRGLGDALLQALIKYARQRNVKYITGFIHPFNGGDPEIVRHWYMKNGFAVKDNLFVYKIELQ